MALGEPLEIEIGVMHEDESPRYRVYTLALFDSWGEEPEGFEFQRDLRHPDDPRAVKPAVFAVVNGRHDAAFGAVKRAVWRGLSCELLFTDDAVQELGLADRHVLLKLDLPASDLERVRLGLVRVFTYGPPEMLPELVGFSQS